MRLTGIIMKIPKKASINQNIEIQSMQKILSYSVIKKMFIGTDILLIQRLVILITKVILKLLY